MVVAAVYSEGTLQLKGKVFQLKLRRKHINRPYLRGFFTISSLQYKRHFLAFNCNIITVGVACLHPFPSSPKFLLDIAAPTVAILERAAVLLVAASTGDCGARTNRNCEEVDEWRFRWGRERYWHWWVAHKEW